MKPPHINLETQRLVRILCEIGEAYRAVAPERYREHSEYIRAARMALKRPSGASDQKILQWACALPNELMDFIEWQIRKRRVLDPGQRFFDRNDCIKLLVKAWPEFKIGK